MKPLLKADRVLVAGEASGRLLLLRAGISFWGGVDPKSSRIMDPRHPDHGAELADRVVAIPQTVGSSSGSSIVLELAAAGRSPAAILLGEADAITTLGAVVAQAMGFRPIPVLALSPSSFGLLPQTVAIASDGAIYAA